MTNFKNINPSQKAYELFTPSQLSAIDEFITPPEDADTWVVYGDRVVHAFKQKVRIQEGHVTYYCLDFHTKAPIPGEFTLGVDAFDSEFEATRALREIISRLLSYYVEMGEELLRKEKELQSGR